MKDITLRAQWRIKAPLDKVFALITDFEKWPEYFPKVADSIRIIHRDGNTLELAAVVKSFGRMFPVKMKTQLLPGGGFISDNESPSFGTSGHEELLLSQYSKGSLDSKGSISADHSAETLIDYTYQVTIHKRWLRIIARPLIGWFSMKFWEMAVIDELKKRVEGEERK